MRTLLRALQRAWLRHQLRNIAHAIDFEQRDHRAYEHRLAHWYGERMKVLAQLRATEQPATPRLASNLMAGRPPR